jgi:hypothetical protein
MNTDEFLARIERQLHGHFGWQGHESAEWTTTAGGFYEGEPDFSHQCKVVTHLRRPSPEVSFPVAMWWKWTAKVTSGGVFFRARGYAPSVQEGKIACERAVRTLALGIATQFQAEH